MRGSLPGGEVRPRPQLPGDLALYISRLARRYFCTDEDRADARQFAWEAVEKAGRNGESKRAAYRAIRAFYMREWRRRRLWKCTAARREGRGQRRRRRQ